MVLYQVPYAPRFFSANRYCHYDPTNLVMMHAQAAKQAVLRNNTSHNGKSPFPAHADTFNV
jgi:hypothetical protein